MSLDALIVLGGGIDQNGNLTEPSRKRIERAAELYRQGVSQRLIMSTKYSVISSFTPPMTEAHAMARYAAELGVPIYVCLEEERSLETIGNALFTKMLYLEPKGWKNVGIVTSKFHMERSKYIFDMVLGEEYTRTYFEAENGLYDGHLFLRRLEEKVLLFVLKKQNRLVSDTVNMVEYLNTEHMAYSRTFAHDIAISVLKIIGERFGYFATSTKNNP